LRYQKKRERDTDSPERLDYATTLVLTSISHI
jgi:hypothetical protein